MSVDYYITCDTCKKCYHVAQDGMSGFSFYTGEPRCMKGIGKFVGDHILCGTPRIVAEQHLDDYDDTEWPL